MAENIYKIDQGEHKSTADQRLCDSTSARVPGEHLGEDRQVRTPGPGRAKRSEPSLLDINVTHLNIQTRHEDGNIATLPARLEPSGSGKYRTREEVREHRQRGRIYRGLMTGFYWNRDARLKFLTLTSSEESPTDLDPSWKELKRRIRRTYGPFEEFHVFTREGNGVIHCAFRGPYIPFPWLQKQWREIHNAIFVNIQEIADYDRSKRTKAGREGINHDHSDKAPVYFPRGLALYFMTQYLGNQSAISHIGQSRHWVYPGVVSDWKHFRKKYPYRTIEERKACITAWHAYLDAKRGQVEQARLLEQQSWEMKRSEYLDRMKAARRAAPR